MANFSQRLAFKFLKANRWKKIRQLALKIFQRFAFKNFPAICFQNFESKSLEKICQLAFKFLKAIWKLFWAEKTKMADIKAIIVIMPLIKNTLYIFLEELKYTFFFIHF